MKNYSCPKCGHTVPLANINVARDVMLCPACGAASSFSSLVKSEASADREDELRRKLSLPPPKHFTIETDPTDMSGKVTVVYRKVSASALFLVPFTCLWAGGSMYGIYGSQIVNQTFDLKQSLFGIPFLIGSIVLVSITLFTLFGKRVLTLERGNGRYFCGVGPFGLRRRFTLNRQARIEHGETSYNVGGGRHGGGHPLPELQLSNPSESNTVHICAGMDEDALDYVEAVLRREAARV